MIHIKNNFVLVLISLAMCLQAVPVLALETSPDESGAIEPTTVLPQILITELQTSYDTAGQEFIELYNASDQSVDLADTDAGAWKIEYFSSTKASSALFDWESATPTGAIQLAGTIAPGAYFILAATDYAPGNLSPHQVYPPKFSDEAGAILLRWTATDTSRTSRSIVSDQLGWRKTMTVEAPNFVSSHATKGSLQRLVSDDLLYFDTSGEAMPFIASSTPSPGAAWQKIDPQQLPDATTDTPEDADVDEPNNLVLGVQPTVSGFVDEQLESAQPEAPVPAPSVEETVAAPVILPIQITELLPNPTPPATDSVDEYVELYNPNDVPVSLLGYRIETGMNNTYKYEFDDLMIGAQSYILVTSGNSPLSLANSGGHARLLNPDGIVVSQSDDYTSAKDGMAWALINGAWLWTDNATPGTANSMPSPVAAASTAATAKATSAAKKTTVKKAAVKKAATKKTTTKTAAAKTAKASAAKAAVATGEEEPEVVVASPIHGGVLAAAGVIAVLYGVYEYRQDLISRIHQLRRYRANRREARAQS